MIKCALVLACTFGVAAASACNADDAPRSGRGPTAASGGWGGGATTPASTATGTAATTGAGGSKSIEPLPFEPGEELPGGDTTTTSRDQDSFSRPAENLGLARLGTFEAGLALFEVAWVFDGDPDRDGLGPTYVGTSCQSCHFRGGRGAPPPPGQPMTSMLVRLSVKVGDSFETDPRYGTQIQNRAVSGVPAEGWFSVSTEPEPGELGDGTPYELLVPTYEAHDLAWGDLQDGTVISPRVAQPMIGLGLLAAIPRARLEELADPDDTDGDGVRGRVQQLESGIGRFGWKANQSSLLQQSADALVFDMGITSTLRPEDDCPPPQVECAAASGAYIDIDDAKLEALSFFSHLIAVPHRTAAEDPEVLLGKGVFHAIGCASCHVPRHLTGSLPGYPELEEQDIWPYTDLLLHDMGERLADGRPDGQATGRDYRTPPLWGLGIVDDVSGHGRLLHDGRARSITEAILWHGGEAESSRQSFTTLPPHEREALLLFLDSL